VHGVLERLGKRYIVTDPQIVSEIEKETRHFFDAAAIFCHPRCYFANSITRNFFSWTRQPNGLFVYSQSLTWWVCRCLLDVCKTYAYGRANRCHSKKTYAIPPAKSDFVFKVSGPGGTEYVKAIATLKPIQALGKAQMEPAAHAETEVAIQIVPYTGSPKQTRIP
jgi:hypothetical protein